VFAIDIVAYTVVSNHTHVDKDSAEKWSKKEVIERWHCLHNGNLLTHKYLRNESLSKGEQFTLDETVNIYRQRLHDISWFMRNLNENT
jgi:hypothetical protein